jgi:hypothetical protein
MISLRTHRYDGVALHCGDAFVAKQRDVKLLTSLGRAVVAYAASDAMRPVIDAPAAENLTAASLDWDASRLAAQADVELMKAEMTAADEPEETPEPQESAAEDAPRQKRKYTRRDLTAE